MLNKIRNKLGSLFFPKLHNQMVEELFAVKEMRVQLKEKIENVSMTDLMREKLSGFNPRWLDSIKSLAYTDLLAEAEHLGGFTEEGFLGKMKQFHEDKELNFLLDWLVRNQIVFTAREAPDLNSVNFGRGTVNGIELAREQFMECAKIWKERHAPPEPFDKHEVL